MKRIMTLMMASLMLTGCSILQTHKLDVEQGNIFEINDARRLHKGMSEAEVREILGDPVLINTFSTSRINYLYTLRVGHGNMTEKRIICTFKNGRLVDVQAA